MVKAKVAYLEATEDVEERGGPDHIQEDPIVVAPRELEGPDGALDGLEGMEAAPEGRGGAVEGQP